MAVTVIGNKLQVELLADESTKAQLNDIQQEVKDLEERLEERVDTIIAGTVDGVSGAEIVDARQGEVTLGANITKVKLQLAQKAEQKELATERARIDNFVSLEQGSTTGDAELEDIRVGADGKTYSNAGTSLRTQLNKKTDNIMLENEINNKDIIEGIVGWNATPTILGSESGVGSFTTNVTQQILRVVFDVEIGDVIYWSLATRIPESLGYTDLVKDDGGVGFTLKSSENMKSDNLVNHSGIFKVTSLTSSGKNDIILYLFGSVGIDFNVGRISIINLTKTYGSGNEPELTDVENLIGQGNWVESYKTLYDLKYVREELTLFKKETELALRNDTDKQTKFRYKDFDIEVIGNGEPINNVSFTKTNQGEPVYVDLDMLSSPDIKEVDFIVAGIDPEGYAVSRDGNKRTNDGGETFENITSNIQPPFIWFDEMGNAYAGIGTSLLRSSVVNGYENYNFEVVAELDNGFLAGFSFETDGMGGVYLAEYSSTTNANNFIYSHNYGETWTKKIIDFNQRHFHTIHFHKPSGNLYLVVGEEGDWKGILKSTDRGQSFTEIETKENIIQPISATTRGKYIVWGKDSNPSGFLVHNTETDEIVDLPVHNAFGSSYPDYTGFYYNKVFMDGSIISASAITTNPEAMFPLVSLDGLSQRSAIFNQHYKNRKYGNLLYGPDKNDNYYLIDNSVSHVFKKLTKTSQRFIATQESTNVIVKDLPSEVVKTRNGIPFKKTGHGITTASGELSLGGVDKIYVTSLLEKGTGGDIRMTLMYVNSENVFNSSYSHINLSNVSVGQINKIVTTYDIPEGAYEINIAWDIYTGSQTPDNYHYVSPISIQTEPNTEVRYALENTINTIEIKESVSPNYLFKDIIHNIGTSELYIDGNEMPILKVNDLEIGLVRKGDETDTFLYIKQNGQLLEEINEIQYGGILTDEKVQIRKYGAYSETQNFRTAPTRIGVTENEVLVYSSETGEVINVNLDHPIIGYLEIELLGNVYHSPHIHQDVSAEDIKERLLSE